jgi:uncharacterized small protein (DUF1192 family)
VDIYVKTRKKTSSRHVIYYAWQKVERARREFEHWQMIGLTPFDKKNETYIEAAHLVIERSPKQLEQVLLDHAERATSPRIGLITDESHRGKPELTGKESVKGGLGLDELLLDMPLDVKELMAQVALLRQEVRQNSLAQNQALIEMIKDLRKQKGGNNE